jgi:hypothetical protein
LSYFQSGSVSLGGEFLISPASRRQLCCIFLGQCWTELVSALARSIERYEFHPILKLLFFFFVSSSPTRSTPCGNTFSTSGVWRFSLTMNGGVLRFGWDGTRATFTRLAWRLTPSLFQRFSELFAASGLGE